MKTASSRHERWWKRSGGDTFTGRHSGHLFNRKLLHTVECSPRVETENELVLTTKCHLPIVFPPTDLVAVPAQGDASGWRGVGGDKRNGWRWVGGS